MKLTGHDLNILTATTKGKTIQFLDAEGQWRDCTQFYDVWAQIAAGLHLTANDSHLIEYRVKPQHESDHIPDTGKMVWQPIETAPKNRVVICVDQRGEVGEACFLAYADEPGWYWADATTPMNSTPTHWMPLPEPPKE